MSTSIADSSAALPGGSASRAPARWWSRRRAWRGWHTGLVLLTVASGFITLWGLQLGQRSEYYASIALSMSQNLSNLFFGAVDPAGTVSLDKIPGSYWVPAVFVRLFGFSTWSVNAPNAIATVLAVLLVAVTAKRLLNPTAGLIAGAVVATTPIVAAVARSNQPESFFVLALALVAWAATKALQGRSLRWLLVAGALVALAFQMYMLEAWAVWPALAAAYLCVKKPWLRKIGDLVLAAMLSLALSLVWIVVVWLVPASARPYVGGTYSNDPFEMVFGYNGLGRFGAASESTAYRSFTPPFSGDPGVLRLFNAELAGQVAWLIPAGLLAIVVLWVLRVPRPLVVFLGGWLVTFLAMFSVVAGMHQFYTAALALPLGLLVGLAFAKARAGGVLWAQLALVGVAAVTAVGIGLYNTAYLFEVAVVQVALAIAFAVLLVLGRRRTRGVLRAGSAWVSVLAGAAMMLTPAVWAVDAMNHPSSINPIAGESSGIGGGFGAGGFGGGAPAAGGGGRGAFAAGGGAAVDQSLIAYLEANRGSASYLFATFGASEAAPYITATDGEWVMPIGGFSAEDPAPTFGRFTELVAAGELRFVLMASQGGFGGAGGATGGDAPAQTSGGTTATDDSTAVADIRTWVSQTCTLVTSPELSTTDLYDCAP
ncbi:ArnT family glycosyltransferase [Herbiconiux sp. YIM B11900]|uniref:ArnT family glycosyltransferase n=1 Tax=Herbiconiux sp. YIM B11900 TaxID=3404131 RepID=UPI003F85EF5F